MVMMVRKKLLLQGQEPRGVEEPRDGGSRGFPRHEAKGGSSIARRLGTRLSTNLSGVLDILLLFIIIFEDQQHDGSAMPQQLEMRMS